MRDNNMPAGNPASMSELELEFDTADMAETEVNSQLTTPSGVWKRRLSQSPIPRPTLPSIAGLRAALLGYLGEVERAVRERVVGEEDDGSVVGFSSPSSLSGSGEDEGAWASANADAGPSTIRRRRITQNDQEDTYLSVPSPGEYSSRMVNAHNRMLEHLSSLREDVKQYLPQIPQRLPVPSATSLGSHADWLRTLPHRLRLVDLGVAPPLSPESQPPGSPIVDHGSVEHARRKVIELAKAYLPSEEWAGWEKLGWEDQGPEVTSRRHSADMGKPIEGEDEVEEEPEYLFPNRTPASAQAMASRRRAVRSKSLGSANFPTLWNVDMPRLVRTRTEPQLARKSDLVEVYTDDSDEDLEDIDDNALLDGVSGALLGEVATTSMGPTVADALKKAEDGKRLIEYDDLPFAWRNNEHIKTGYRFIPLHSSTGPIPLIKSAFTWHNETVNIHSHFIPTIMIMLFIPAIIYSSPLPDAHPIDTATLVIYLLAAISCLFSSASWHVLAGCASHKWFEWGACVDYVGISWLIAASFFTVLYNAFYCQPKTVLIYSTVNLVCGMLGSYLPFQKWFNERKNKNWRISFFLFLCFAMFAPMLQIFFQHGFKRGIAFTGPFGASIMAYVTGLVFYAFHFPECVWPGRFDTWGASHHIWHAGIVVAIVLHYNAIFTAHSMKYDYSCAMPDAGMSVGEVMEKGWWILAESLGLVLVYLLKDSPPLWADDIDAKSRT